MAIKEINDENFAEETKEGLVMIDFWAPWCAPCRMVAPILDELSGDFSGKATIAKINVDENPKVATEYSVTSIPTMIVFNNGEVAEREVGAKAKQYYTDLLNKHL
ncbi:MAG: thioredoxin [Leptospirales bacterium]